jgi:heme-degrading monooxygenase HmoA
MPDINVTLATGKKRMDIIFIIVVMLAMTFLVTSCKMGMPFHGPITEIANPSSEETAVIALTYVKTGNDAAKNNVFWEHLMKVDAAMPTQKGYLGHALRRVILGTEGWTMTVWENEQSLNAFVLSKTHQAAIQNGLGAVSQGRFARVTVKKSEVPISWKKAEQLLTEQGRNLY